MAIPKEAVALVDAWCEERTPVHVRDTARLEATVIGNTLTIYECTLRPDIEWLRVPSAQLRYDQGTRIWSLYWIDSHDNWHIVQTTPTLLVEELLDEIDADPDCLFFG